METQLQKREIHLTGSTSFPPPTTSTLLQGEMQSLYDVMHAEAATRKSCKPGAHGTT